VSSGLPPERDAREDLGITLAVDVIMAHIGFSDFAFPPSKSVARRHYVLGAEEGRAIYKSHFPDAVSKARRVAARRGPRLRIFNE
jgi:hypothetical protein